MLINNYNKDRDAKPNDFQEMRAFVGLLILSGIYKAWHVNVCELWNLMVHQCLQLLHVLLDIYFYTKA